MKRQLNRRNFIATAAASIAAAPLLFAGEDVTSDKPDQKLLLLRYDTETWQPDKMQDFLPKVIEVHRKDKIPATFFCKGATLDLMPDEFKAFYSQVKDDPLFDIQDHSYSHIGLGYEKGKPVNALKADYEKSFAAHQRIFGVQPIGISICGTSGADGPALPGFDATEKSRAELDMVASLGVRMINSNLTGIDGSRKFVNYNSLSHPEMMGFISAHSDTSWMLGKKSGDPTEYILAEMAKRADAGDHMPVMLHDWVAWLHAPDQQLTHVRKIVEAARKQGYKPVTHMDCLKDKNLWA